MLGGQPFWSEQYELLHVALHVQAVALARSRQRMSAATVVFMGIWQRLGQLLGRKSVGETGPQMDGGSSSITSSLPDSRASVAVFDARAHRRERAEKLVWAARFPRASYPTACGQKFRARRRSRVKKAAFQDGFCGSHSQSSGGPTPWGDRLSTAEPYRTTHWAALFATGGVFGRVNDIDANGPTFSNRPKMVS